MAASSQVATQTRNNVSTPPDDDPVGWRTLARYWSSGQELPIEKTIKLAVLLCRIVSLSNFKLRVERALKMRHGMFMDLYISGWALGLTCLLFLGGHAGNYWAAAVAGYWIFDSNAYRLYFLFIKSVNRPWGGAGVRRSMLIGMISLYVAVVAFATLYLTIGRVVCVVKGDAQGDAIVQPIQAFYYSAVTMTLLGYGDFVPDNNLTQVIVMVQLFTAVLLIMFIVPALISVYSSPRVAEGAATAPDASRADAGKDPSG